MLLSCGYLPAQNAQACVEILYLVVKMKLEWLSLVKDAEVIQQVTSCHLAQRIPLDQSIHGMQ